MPLKSTAPPDDDALSDVLSVCRAERAVTGVFELGAPWSLRSEGVPGAMIRVARGAPFWLVADGLEPVRLEPGDLAMLPVGTAHTVASALDVAPMPFQSLRQQQKHLSLEREPLVISYGGGGSVTHMYSALVWFSSYCQQAVIRLLPPLIVLRASGQPVAASLADTVETLVVETMDRRPGWRASTARLGELVLIQVLRNELALQGTDTAHGATGWFRGLGDRHVARSLVAMHRAPRKAWTVELLADEAGMSRSRFNERFRQLVGTTPIDYLTSHRMAMAAEQLEDGVPGARVAEEAGYESVKAFTRAFQRWSGVTPAGWKREATRRRVQYDEAARAVTRDSMTSNEPRLRLA